MTPYSIKVFTKPQLKKIPFQELTSQEFLPMTPIKEPTERSGTKLRQEILTMLLRLIILLALFMQFLQLIEKHIQRIH